VVGADGVGRLDDGTRVYFLMPHAPHGAMAEETVVPSRQCLPLPDQLDSVTAAAIANPAMSSWAALTERAKLEAGETVLINGATGAAGQLAVQIARRLGAAKLIATGRRPEALREAAALGADLTIPLVEDEAALDESFAAAFDNGVDVVIDYLWGTSAERLLIAAAKAGKAPPVRFVQIGSASGGTIALPSAILRSAPITLMGNGLGSVPPDRLLASIGAALQAAATGGLKIAAKPFRYRKSNGHGRATTAASVSCLRWMGGTIDLGAIPGERRLWGRQSPRPFHARPKLISAEILAHHESLKDAEPALEFDFWQPVPNAM
jgi:NADPH:quinone reductase-like Zn-dependent oxidoreductase